MELNDTKKEFLNRAIEALHSRDFWAGYPEHPKAYPEDGDTKGRDAFNAHLGNPFSELGTIGKWIGTEESPYTQEPLRISYPSLDYEDLIKNGTRVSREWKNTPIDVRASILMDSLDAFRDRFFEVAYATMHTTGQGYMMAFQASGPHAADRALEAIAAGYEELTRFPERTTWDKPMGKFNIVLEKQWKSVPKGLSLVIGCSTFPVWNSVPGIYASLITGNPVIMKPHPGAILPIAIVVAEIRNSLRKSGIDPDVCQLAPDTHDAPITVELAEHPAIKIIDFTGNSAFGSKLEALPGKEVFTEKTGVNCAIIDSAADVDQVAANLAFSLCLYSGQMCTAPQNFLIPATGIKTPEGNISYEEFKGKLMEQVTGLCDNPKAGPYVLGAIQNKATCDRVNDLGSLKASILLAARHIENPMFPNARTMSPALLEVDVAESEVYNAELFGPVGLIIKTEDTDQATRITSQLAREKGAISCAVYCTDPERKERMAEELTDAGAPVSFNLTGGIYVNQHAGFSDFHVTGANPAGNASLTDPKFVVRRFNWVGIRDMA